MFVKGIHLQKGKLCYKESKHEKIEREFKSIPNVKKKKKNERNSNIKWDPKIH